MLVSVIVPVRNEAANIQRTLECLCAQEFNPLEYEILVVDGLSEDDTTAQVEAVAQEHAHVRLLTNPKRLSSAARNIGIRASHGRYVIIVDGHCAIHDRGYLTNVVEAFEQSGADSLGRPQPLRTEGASPFQEAVAAARKSWLGHNPDSDIYSEKARFTPPDNVAVAYRREVFDRVGYFDEQFDACEDVEFNTRVRMAGLTCYFTPAIRVDYQPRATLPALLFQMFRYGAGRSRLGRKHRGSITLPSLVPVFWLLWLPVSFALGFVLPFFAMAFCGSLLLYSLSILAESLRLSIRRPARLLTRTPFVFFAIHIGFGWGFLRDRLAPFTFRQRTSGRLLGFRRSVLP